MPRGREADPLTEDGDDADAAESILFGDGVKTTEEVEVTEEEIVQEVRRTRRGRPRKQQVQAQGQEEEDGATVKEMTEEVIVVKEEVDSIEMEIITHAKKTNRTSMVIESEIPECCKKSPCVLGVDEAGRGPVCGPMVYGVAFAPKSLEEKLKNMGFTDSKKVAEHDRRRLFNEMKTGSLATKMGWKVHSLSATKISDGMLSRQKYSLNDLSHDTCIDLIRRCLNAGVNVQSVYVDTVGPDHVYQAKLQREFPNLKITVTSKADLKYVIVSAASICAKVVRDAVLEHWNHPEKIDVDREFGCGYPSDPKTKAWLRANMDNVFGFPSVVRFSWQTAQSLLDQTAVAVTWEDDCEEDEDGFGEQATDGGSGFSQVTKRAKVQTTLFGDNTAAKRKIMKSHAFYRQAGLCTTEDFSKNM
eukprot:m.152525 g.152525  ORF g.152525 m.152525 type:complete len:416 (-) comp16214_c0_seq1:189-1436(-)